MYNTSIQMFSVKIHRFYLETLTTRHHHDTLPTVTTLKCLWYLKHCKTICRLNVTRSVIFTYLYVVCCLVINWIESINSYDLTELICGTFASHLFAVLFLKFKGVNAFKDADNASHHQLRKDDKITLKRQKEELCINLLHRELKD